MNADQLDEAYTMLCRNLEVVGEAGTSPYLARLALLLMLDARPDAVRSALNAALPTTDAQVG